MGLHNGDVLRSKPRPKRNYDSVHSWILEYDLMGVFQKWLNENEKTIMRCLSGRKNATTK